MPAYNEKIRDHYANPRNMGSIERTAAKAVVRSPVDSDTVQITLQIENGIVVDAKFKCMGCAVAMACSSAATEIVKGLSLDDASRISKQQVSDYLGGIPEIKNLCSNLAPDAIRQAIAAWRSAANRDS